jgi:hypothetical protein
MHDVCSSHMLFLDLFFHITFSKSTNYEGPYYAIFYVLYYFLSHRSNIFLTPYVQTPLTDVFAWCYKSYYRSIQTNINL